MKALFRWLARLDFIGWILMLFVLCMIGGGIAEAIDFFDRRACRNSGGMVISEGGEWHCARRP